MKQAMKVSFSTLGCPDWTLDQVLKAGADAKLDGFDLRGLRGGVDVTVLPEFTSDLESTSMRIRDSGLVVSGFSSGITLCDASRHAVYLEEARRIVPIARALGTKVIRVFGGAGASGTARNLLLDAACACMDSIMSIDGALDLTWAVETHDEWIRSVDVLDLVRNLDSPAVGIVWDVGHTTRVAEETPATTWNLLGPLVRCLHIKDAVKAGEHVPGAMPDGWRYVLPGTGRLPLAETISMLQSVGYCGWITFEHEKRWLPDLEDPEYALAVFAKWIHPLLGVR